ncbi:MAG: amino acid ABC transporter substrate-binding protein [Tistlia sp.]|uniref:amino acid ABC transporter substrate-binding protein n=1 Tax=Tistlia sp. TaxID=3057121 RepID=UPI0034A1498A
MRRAISRYGLVAGLLSLLAAPAPVLAQAEGPALERIRSEGLLRCGVVRTGPGVSETDSLGVWRGFFPDYCRALAAAVLGDAEAVEFVEVSYTVRFEALREGAFDVLMGNTTWTASRDTALGLAFTAPLYYDGQGFMASKALGATKLADVGEATVCVHRNTTTIATLEELVATRGLRLEIRGFDSTEGVYDAFFAHDCEILSQDRIALTSVRLSRAPDPEDYVLFTDVVSKEPLGPALRSGDEAWFDVVQWTVFATFLAEELGIRSDTLASHLDSPRPETRRLLGTDPGIGRDLGLTYDWARQVIAQVGNYEEIFERNLAPLGLDRGLNRPWSEGGLLYAPPLR